MRFMPVELLFEFKTFPPYKMRFEAEFAQLQALRAD